MRIMLKWMLLVVLILVSGSLANGEDVLNTDKIVSSVKEKLSKVSDCARMPGLCIFKVPSSISRNDYYTPQLVSIGPFHRGSVKLKPMEVHKLLYLEAFLRRAKPTIEDFVNSLGTLEERARRCYSETINLTIDEFVEMMLIDGSFIIEFMFRFNYSPDAELSNDLIFSSSSMYLTVQTDLELLENQLPFFVIDHLYNLVSSPYQKCGPSVVECITQTFLKDSSNALTMTNFTSFVDIFRAYYVPKSDKREPKGPFKFVPTATELDEIGMEFKSVEDKSLLDVILKSGEDKSLLDVILKSVKDKSLLNVVLYSVEDKSLEDKSILKEKRMLSIPVLTLSASTITILRNVIALEHYSNSSYVTDYVYLMNGLINTEGDVILLRKAGIITSLGDSDKQVVDLFNSLNAGTTIDPDNFFYAALFEELNIYHNQKWNDWRGKLKRFYFHILPRHIHQDVEDVFKSLTTIVSDELKANNWRAIVFKSLTTIVSDELKTNNWRAIVFKSLTTIVSDELKTNNWRAKLK